MTRSRYVIWAGIGLGVVLGGVWAFWPRAILVDIAEATRGHMEVAITEEGEARVRDLFIVSAPASGYLNRIDIDPGECVVAGESRLADIHSPAAAALDVRTQAQLRAAAESARASLRMADADVRMKQAELEQVTADLDRMRRLALTGTVSAQTLERAEVSESSHSAALAAATSARDVARFEIARAEAALIPSGPPSSDAIVGITAPVTGLVLRVLRDSEGPIIAGAPILEIGQSSDIEVVVDVLSEDAVRIREGAKVRVRGWGGAPQWARVKRVEPYAFTKVSALGIEEQRTNVIIDFDTVTPRIGHGYRVRADIIIWQRDDALRLPMASLFKTSQGWSVYRIERGRARLRSVRLGQMNGALAEVLDGVSGGDRVVQHPSSALFDGAKVKARETQFERSDESIVTPDEVTLESTAINPCEPEDDAAIRQNTLDPTKLVERDPAPLAQPRQRP